ncbi:acetolactate synthase large subunit [Candidatus Woesearchaeota archaeon]|nr:MAG: acetolactate synthase large subunit [Candidatus Woesearchaeota archaeon]
MKASDVMVKCLENEGVEYIFGIPGEENIDLMDSLRESKIKFVTTRHEQGAAFMADVYGRLTGKAGVCLATLGPGATNLVTGVADANLDKAPLVAITGQAGLERMHKESHQYMDVVHMFEPITKWNARIHSIDIIPEVVRKAFRIAQAEKPGATHIELPEDVAKSEVPEEFATPIPISEFPKTHPEREEIDRAKALIRSAKFPVILAGNGVIRAHASHELVHFAEMNNIPVANTFMAKGAIPSNHPLSISTIGLQANDYVLCEISKADLIIAIGYDLAEYSPAKWNPDRDKKVLVIDSQPAEVDSHMTIAHELVGDIRQILRSLGGTRIIERSSEYARTLKKIIEEERDSYRNDSSFPMKPQKIILDIRAAMKEEDILISDVGAHKLWIARMYPAYKPNTCIISNGFASMGIAIPGAIGAKLAKPHLKVVAATGDGGFLMNSQELETAKRLGLSFVVIIFNDSRYGVIEWKQMKTFGRSTAVEFTNPDFVKYAESFGAKGVRIRSADELLPALKAALDSKDIWVIDVPVDASENLRLQKMLERNVCPPDETNINEPAQWKVRNQSR